MPGHAISSCAICCILFWCNVRCSTSKYACFSSCWEWSLTTHVCLVGDLPLRFTYPLTQIWHLGTRESTRSRKVILTFPLCFLKIIVRLSFQKYPPYSKMEGILTLDDKRTQKIVNKPLSISDIMFSLAHASFPKSVFSILYTKHRINFLQTHQYLGS